MAKVSSDRLLPDNLSLRVRSAWVLDPSVRAGFTRPWESSRADPSQSQRCSGVASISEMLRSSIKSPAVIRRAVRLVILNCLYLSAG